jgi:hypothetical protein
MIGHVTTLPVRRVSHSRVWKTAGMWSTGRAGLFLTHACSAVRYTSASAPIGTKETEEKPLWDDCDTVEDIMDEIKFGSTDDQAREARIEAFKASQAAVAASASASASPRQQLVSGGYTSAAVPPPRTEDDPVLSEDDKIAEQQRLQEAEDAARIAMELSTSLPFGIPGNISEADHHAIARRALLLGTGLAFAFFFSLVGVGMATMGFTTLAEVLAYVGSKDARHVERLREQGETVVMVDLDLTDPANLPTQFNKVIDIVQQHAFHSDGSQVKLATIAMRGAVPA